MLIDCFTKNDIEGLKEKFNARITKDMSEEQQRAIGKEIALDYHKQLHDELNGLRKKVGKPAVEYTPQPDFAAKEKSINEDYQNKIDEVKGALKSPIPIEKSVEEEPPPPVTEQGEVTDKGVPEGVLGIKNSIVNESRIHRGLEPLVKEAKRKLGKVWADVKNAVLKGKSNPNKLVNDTYAKILSIKDKKGLPIFNDFQNGELLFHRLDTTNRIKTGEDILSKIDALGSDATPENIMKAFEGSADWLFKSDADKKKFQELLSRPEATPDIVKSAMQDVINDFHFDLEKNDLVAEKTGTAWGQAGRFRQLLINLQGETVNWTKQAERQMGSHADPEVLKTLSSLESEYKDTIEQLKQQHTEELQQAAENAYKKAVELLRKEKPKSDAAKKEKTLKEKGEDAAAKILKFKIKLGEGGLQSNILGLPIAVYNALVDSVALIVKGGATIGDAISEVLKDAKFKGLSKDDVINHFTGGFERAEKKETILDELKKQSEKDSETSISKDNVKKIKQLMSLHIDDGTKDLQDLIDRTKEDLKDILPDATDDVIRDALSGRGVRADAKPVKQTDLQRLKTQASNVGKYMELLQPKENETDSEKVKRIRKLTDLYEGGIKDEISRLGIVPPNDQLRLKDIDDKRLVNSKSGVQNVIDKLDTQLNKPGLTSFETTLLKDEKSRLNSKLGDVSTGKFSPEQRLTKANNVINDQISIYETERSKLTNAFRKDKPKVGTSEYDAEKEKVDVYSKRIKDLRSERDKVNIDNKLVSMDVDNEVVAAKLQDSLNNSINKLQDDIDSEIFEEKKPNKPTGLESIMTSPDPTRIAKIRQLEQQRNLLELKKRDAIDRYNLSKRGIAAKVADALVRSKRMFVLVKVAILAKLGAAVAWGQTVFAPLKTLSGAMWNKVGDVLSGGWVNGKSNETTWSKFLDKSVRYGRVHAQSELQAYNRAWSYDNFKKGIGKLGFTKDTARKMDGFKNQSTLQAFSSDFNNNYNELSLLFGKDVNPSEYYANVSDEARFYQKEFWGTVGGALDFAKKTGKSVVQIGEYGIRTHGAIKGVAKGMEFARSYFTIKENAKRINGEGWAADPVNQMSMGMLAYQESVRGILMEDNRLSEMYQKAIKTIKKGEGLGSQAAYLLTGEFLPVVKVPTNIALQAGRAALGLPLSGGEIALRLISEKLNGTKIAKITGTGEFLKRNGIETMSNEHASALLRNLRDGTVGAFLMTGMVLGAMASSHYYLGKKQKEDEEATLMEEGKIPLEEGEVSIGGITVAHDLADNPFFVAMKMGQTSLKAFQWYQEDKGDSFIAASAKALGVTALGVIKESPIVSTPTQLVSAMEGQQNMGWFWQNLVVSSTYPSIMRELAMYTDKEDGNLIPFKGKSKKRLQPTLWDTYKAWTPGWRQTLDTP